MKERFHLTFQVSNYCFDHVCQEEAWILPNVCQLPWIESTHHQKLIPTTFDIKIIGSTQSCQSVLQDCLTWCIQFGAYSKR
jgi:hypothetical protein